ncbi:MAG: hypothetical protein ACRYFU_08440 [Janthinobacterium lividum]
MSCGSHASFRSFLTAFGLSLLIASPACRADQPTPAATAAFNAYAHDVEARLAQQHRDAGGFLPTVTASPDRQARLRRGELIVEQLTPTAGTALQGALLHHWRGTAFAPGATAADFERLMRDVDGYPQYFSPEVLRARVLQREGDRLQISMRVRQHHVLTVVMDTTYEVTLGRRNAAQVYSLARSTHVAELSAPGTPQEHMLSDRDAHGFLWRIDTYWTCEERDGGLYLQVESVSLTRSIPHGLGWVVEPFVQSIPRESLEFTLHSTCNALRRSNRTFTSGRVDSALNSPR